MLANQYNPLMKSFADLAFRQHSAEKFYVEGGFSVKVTEAQTEKILKGNQPFKQFAFSMMITRLKSVYTKDPSASTLKASAIEINKFLEHFSAVMGSDYESITNM